MKKSSSESAIGLLVMLKTYFNGDSAPFSAIALIALSKGSCTFAQAKSNSVRLCAHFDAINSRPDLCDKRYWNISQSLQASS